MKKYYFRKTSSFLIVKISAIENPTKIAFAARVRHRLRMAAKKRTAVAFASFSIVFFPKMFTCNFILNNTFYRKV
jgi:hypothetical protein